MKRRRAKAIAIQNGWQKRSTFQRFSVCKESSLGKLNEPVDMERLLLLTKYQPQNHLLDEAEIAFYKEHFSSGLNR